MNLKRGWSAAVVEDQAAALDIAGVLRLVLRTQPRSAGQVHGKGFA
jgi:hypothetical protein